MIQLLLILALGTSYDYDAEAALALARAKRERAPAAKLVHTKPATHSHKCAFCGTVWSHSDDSFGIKSEHTCPKCGQVQWQVYQRFK